MCKHFHSWKCIRKCCLPDSGYFVLASMCWAWSDTNIFKDNNSELDEMTACRHLKSPQSLPNRSLYLTLVTKRSRPCMWLKVKVTLLFHIKQPCHSWDSPIQKFAPWKSKFNVMTKVKINAYIWGQIFNPHVCFSLCGNQIHFWLRYSKFHLWPWKCNVKVMAKVKSDGHIRGLVFNQYICFLFLWESDHFWLIYSTFHIWPWKFKVRVTSKINQNLIR